MSLILYPQRFDARGVAANSDEVIFGLQIPGDCEFQALWGKVHGVATGDIDVQNAVWAAMSIYMANHADPDDQTSFNTLWDEIVPKDNLEVPGAFDLDQATADASPDFNIGEPDIMMLFDSGQPPIKLWERQEMVTFASSPLGHTAVGADQDDYWPTFVWDGIRSKKQVKTDVPTVLMAGFSSPDTPAQTTTLPAANEQAYPIIKFMKSMLEYAWIEWMNLTEPAGGELPFEQIALIIAAYLEPAAFIETAARMPAINWNVYSNWRAQIKVPGELSIGSISAG